MPDKLNLIFIMPDQMRHDFLSCYGASFIETPNIDALGQAGATYRNAYSEHPICVPARCALITGMDAIKSGVVDNGQFIRPDYQACGIQTWPEILNENGYMTVATGKMHFYPWEKRMGFQHRISAEDKFWGFIQDDYYHYLKQHGYSKRSFFDVPEYHENFQALVSPLPWAFGVDHFVGMESVRWIDDYEGDRPFAMMIGFPGPHVPYDPAEEYATFDLEDMHELGYFCHGDDGRLRGWRTVQVWDSDHPYMNHWWVPGCAIGYEHAHIHALVDFLEGVAKGEKMCPDFRDGLATQCVCDAVLDSASDKKWKTI